MNKLFYLKQSYEDGNVEKNAATAESEKLKHKI
jgi:hypothetical protein